MVAAPNPNSAEKSTPRQIQKLYQKKLFSET